MDLFLFLTDFTDWGFLFLRLAIGSVFLHHAYQKIDMWETSPSNKLPANMVYLLRLVSLVEVTCAFALISGTWAQLAALGLSIVMVGAMYMKIIPWKKKFSGDGGWELDFTLLSILLFMFIAGAGEISFDFALWGI